MSQYEIVALILCCNFGHYQFTEDEKFLNDLFRPLYTKLGSFFKYNFFKDIEEKDMAIEGNPKKVIKLNLRLQYANYIKIM